MSIRYVYQNKKATFCSIVISTGSEDQKSWSEYHESCPFKFDNGDAFPEKIYYSEASYDKDLRIFKGTLDFASPAGAIIKWIHQFHFSEDMSCVIEGFASGLDIDGKEKYRFSYGKEKPEVTVDCGLVVKAADQSLDLIRSEII